MPPHLKGRTATWALALALAVLCGCGDEVELIYPGAPDQLRAGLRCGACLTHPGGAKQGFGSEGSARVLGDLSGDLGMGLVSLTVRGQLPTLDSVGPVTSPVHPSGALDRLEVDAARARALGMTVMIKPHLSVAGAKWAGAIAPAAHRGGWASWFSAYEAYLMPVARLAHRVKAGWLCVGVELPSASRVETARWRTLIGKVRGAYSGKLAYCANWDEAHGVPFWGDLDGIGVQMFAPLTDGAAPSQDALDRGATAWLLDYHELAVRHRKPLLLTEVGFVNRQGTAEEPWVWPGAKGAATRTAAGDQEQARAYLAIVHTFGQSPHVAAISWWRWYTDPAYVEPNDVGFAPRPPGLAVLRGACR